MPALAQNRSVTLEDYEKLPEDVRAEVFSGEIFYMASPSQDHQAISMELSSILNSYIKKKAGTCRVFAAPFDVKLFDHPLTLVQPDLMIICDKSKLDGQRCNGAPDFIIERGKLKLERAPFDFKKQLSGIVTMFYQQAKQKQIDFHLHMNGVTEEHLQGDELRVSQIMMNLLSNAMKFTPIGGKIDFTVT